MTKKKLYRNQNSTNNSSVAKSTIEKPVKNVPNSSRSITGIKGLQNLGNTCYFNSMLQMLLNSPCFLNQLKTYCSTEPTIFARLPEKEYELVLKTAEVSLVEKELLSIWESEKESIAPSSLRSALLQHKDFKTHFNGFNEHDSHEVFLMVLNIIKEAQIKRIRGSILDLFNSRKNISVDDETKMRIKEISAAVVKQTLVNNQFGIVIGSNLKCQSCGELRMRFDEVFHLTPMFLAKHEFDHTADTGIADSKGDSEIVILKPKNHTVPTEKMSKHQLKRQKRVEKKMARNKKSTQRNVECSPEEMYANGNANTGSASQNNADIIDEEESEEEDDNGDGEIVIGGHDDDIMDEDYAMQQLIYDTVTLESMTNKKASSQCSSSTGSMVARKNDSSRVSMTSLNSSVEDVICHQLIRDLSVEDRNTDIDPTNDNECNDENNNDICDSLDNNSCREMMDEDSDVDKMSSAGNIIRANVDRVSRADVCCEADNEIPRDSEPEPEREEQSNNNVVIIDSRTTDKTKASLQSAFSSALETHQDRICSRLSQKKIAFETETDLDRALGRFTVPIFLENIVCDTCSSPSQKKQTDHFKTDVLCHLPQILPFYISRFKQCTARNRTKNTQVYSYPSILNLSSQCSKYANFSSDTAPVLYRLFGIIEHIGARINSGHYVSYVSRPSNREPSSSPDTTTTAASTNHTYSCLYPTNMLSDLSRKHEEDRYKDFQWTDNAVDDDDEDNDRHNNDPTDYKWFRISDSHVESVSIDTVMKVQAFMLFYSRFQ